MLDPGGAAGERGELIMGSRGAPALMKRYI